MKPIYSPKEREAAVALYESEGLAGAHRATGISKPSIKRWAERSGVVTFHEEKVQAATEARNIRIAALRAVLKERMLQEAAYCMEAIHNEHIDFKSAGPLGPMKVVFPVAPAAAVQHYATAFGILIDKFRLESGEVTSRDEHRNIDQSDIDRELAGLCAEMARREKAAGDTSDEGEAAMVTLGAALSDAQTESIS